MGIMRFGNFGLVMMGLIGVFAASQTANAQTKIYTAASPLEEVERDCARNIKDACLAAFLRFHEGRGVRADPKRAEWYMLRSCETGEAIACSTYATIIENKPDGKSVAAQVKALEYVDKACKMGDVNGCTRANRLRAALPRDAVEPSGPDLIRACEAGRASACSRHAYNLGVQKKWKEAIPYAQRGCALGDRTACGNAEIFARNQANAEDYAWRQEQRRREDAERQARNQAWAEEQQARQAENAVPAGRRSNYRPATGAPVGSAGNGSAAPRQQVCTETYLSGPNGGRIVRCR